MHGESSMVNGNGKVTDLDEAVEDKCVVGTTEL